MEAWGRSFRSLAAAAAVALALSAACSTPPYRAEFAPPSAASQLDSREQFLKCHMENGDVYVLEKWAIRDPPGIVEGTGIRYDASRQPVSRGRQQVPLTEIELLETNDPRSVSGSGVPVMGVVTAMSLAVTAACAANPKACFGSCPTFYVSDGHDDVLAAEGFSASVARSLEATDVDALWTARPASRTLDVQMKNEAPESHFVNSVRILAVARPPGGRVLRSGDVFFPTTHIEPPSSCRAERGSCLDDVAEPDRREYASAANADDLATKESIDLEFQLPSGAAGVVISARNTLLNTFLFYQLLAYMGRSAGDWYVEMDRGMDATLGVVAAFRRLLGDIEVAVRGADGTYRPVGVFAEVGPIARDVQLVPIPEQYRDATEPLGVRLTMTKGNWKIDRIGLATLGDPVAPRTVELDAVYREGHADREAFSFLHTGGARLMTMPGDVYTLRFTLPPGDQELFLESRGYYYEWIRKAWLKEENPAALERVRADPEGTLRRLAAPFKRIEADMERVFWGSRVGQK